MKSLLFGALALCVSSAAFAQHTIYSTADFAGWFKGTQPTFSAGDLITTASATNAALTYFRTPGNQYQMAVGESLTLSANFTMNTGSSVSSSRTFYLTLQNSGSTGVTNNQVSSNLAGATANALFASYSGYGLLTNPGPSNASAGQFNYRSGTNTNITGSTSPWVLPTGVSAMTSTTFSTAVSNDYNISFVITKVSSSAVDFSYVLTNTTSSTVLANYSASATGISAPQFIDQFDTIALGVSGAQTGSFKFYDLSLVSSIPEPSTYALGFGALALCAVLLRRRRHQAVA